MGDCTSPAVISDIASKDTLRLIGTVAKTLAANSPFINVLNGGTFPSQVADEVRSAVQMPAAPGDSLAIPTFLNDTEVCGTSGDQDKTGTIEYVYRLGTKRGTGPRICVKQGFASFKTSYLAAEDSLAKLITQYINADVKAQLFLKSASKFIAAKGYCFEDIFTGGNFEDLGVDFAAVPLDSVVPMTFKALHFLARYLKEVLWADMWPSDGKAQEHYRVIAGADQIELFRNEIGVEHILCCLTQGGYKVGEAALSGYSWESAPAFRGLAFGTDQTPLRFNEVDVDGVPVFLNPRVNVADGVKNTAYSKTSATWLAADFEVGFLIAEQTFKRLVPERFVGEGSFKFAPQLHMGELEWSYLKDNDCNRWGDFGEHIYQIIRAYQPVRPHHIIPFAYRRCKADLGLESCELTSCNSL